MLSAAVVCTPAQAVLIGGYDIGATGAYDFLSSVGNLAVTNTNDAELAIEDASVETFVSAVDGPATVALNFAAGDLVDRVGADLVVFEIGTPERFNVEVNGTVFANLLPSVVLDGSVPVTITGTPPSSESRNLNAYAIDLAGIDLSGGASVLIGLAEDGADFALAGAVVPIPAAIWMFGSGLIGLVGIARRRRA